MSWCWEILGSGFCLPECTCQTLWRLSPSLANGSMLFSTCKSAGILFSVQKNCCQSSSEAAVVKNSVAPSLWSSSAVSRVKKVHCLLPPFPSTHSSRGKDAIACGIILWHFKTCWEHWFFLFCLWVLCCLFSHELHRASSNKSSFIFESMADCFVFFSPELSHSTVAQYRLQPRHQTLKTAQTHPEKHQNTAVVRSCFFFQEVSLFLLAKESNSVFLSQICVTVWVWVVVVPSFPLIPTKLPAFPFWHAAIVLCYQRLTLFYY